MNTKFITKHLTWIVPVAIALIKVLIATNVLKLSVQDEQTIVDLLTSVGLGSAAHQLWNL